MIAGLWVTGTFAQDRKDAGSFIEAPKNIFWEKIKSETDTFRARQAEKEDKRRLLMDFSNVDIPKSIKEFTMIPSEKPVSQGITGTCWCFSTSSFFDSEIMRISKEKNHATISPMFTVYWQYVEKAREYVKTRGTSNFDEGSETNAVQEMMKKYGAVPLEDYSGLQSGQPFYDHSTMVKEMKDYLAGIKAENTWNEDAVLSTIRSIMDHYMGVPPTSVEYAGKKWSPKEYLVQITGLTPDDYVTFMSLKSAPYWSKAEYKVPDNWWHSDNYYNVPLDDYISLIKDAVKRGYSISIGGDVSESGINSKLGVMMIPSYDIPSDYINEDARLLRFTNGATTDDHAMHIVGYAERKNGFWFLVKDSGAGGHNNESAPGYWYVYEDYVKLKMMTATVHKDAVKQILSRIGKTASR